MIRNKIIFIIALFAVLAFSSLCWADPSVEANAFTRTEAQAVIIDDSVSDNPRQHITLIPHQLPNILPPLYKDAGWKVWDDVFYTQNPITIQMMDAMRRPANKQWINYWCKLDKNKDPVQVLTGMPTKEMFAAREDGKANWKVIGVVTVRGRTEANLEETVFEALYHAKKKTRIKRCLVLIKTQLVTTGKVLAWGTVVGANKMLGHNTDPDKIAAGVAGGSGYGKSTSFVDTRPYVKVICFN